MADRNFLVGFVSIDNAQAAAKALNEAGFHEVQVANVSPYPGQGVQEVMNPITGDFPSLGYLTLDADFSSKSESIMAATDVDASGMSDGDGMMPEVNNQGVLLTAVIPEDQASVAEQILSEHGGFV